jgi:uncharacterized protein YjlB
MVKEAAIEFEAWDSCWHNVVFSPHHYSSAGSFKATDARKVWQFNNRAIEQSSHETMDFS